MDCPLYVKRFKMMNLAFNLREKIFSFISRCSFRSSSFKKREFLLLSSTGNAHGLFYPFHFYRQELAEQLGIYFREEISDSLEEKKRSLEAFCGDVVFITMPLRLEGEIFPKEKLLSFFQKIKRHIDCKLVYFDISDNAISPYFDILPYVDLFLMPFVFRDRKNYEEHFLGGNIVADFLARRCNVMPTRENEYYDEFFYSRPLKEEISKIVPSWNWMLWRRLVRSFGKHNFHCLEHKEHSRSIDISCRFSSYEGWCRIHRMSIYHQLKMISSSYCVVAGAEKVALSQYYNELKRAKIAFSPFGYGEICPKDFEAIMKGALLVKPSVEHLITFPELHIPYETYVPVPWDLSNLKEKLIEYIEDVEKRKKIVENAAEAYERFFREKKFLSKMEEILNRLVKR